MAFREEALAQLNALVQTGTRIRNSYQRGDWASRHTGIPEADLRAFLASCASAVVRIAGKDSEFYRHLPELPGSGHWLSSMQDTMEAALGTVTSLRDAVASGYLAALEQRIRANVEDDFLEQGATLLASGYHVAAMVLIGGVLEDRLQAMCAGFSLAINGSGSLSKYNDALHKAGAYDQPAWRRVQSIADLRNNAAHGGAEAAKIKAEDVEDSLKYVRRFLSDFPG